MSGAPPAAAVACAVLAVLAGLRPPADRRLSALRPPVAGRAVRGRGRPVAARAASRPRGTPIPVPVLLDLLAEVLAGGAPMSGAVAAVAAALRRVGDPQAAALADVAAALARSGSPPAGRPGTSGLVGRLTEALDLAVATGSSPVGLLRAAAEEDRRARAARQVRAARRLGVLVLLPTGLCLLPAFVLLTEVPLAIGLARG